ncbi:kinase-like domain-containing protein [Rhizophagus irregularis DAOM 181602=DAOM 197198]|nr:kinase-like domain-containing protein [Rhizophagus irregularis DAOM 181602=DAOM 197198]
MELLTEYIVDFDNGKEIIEKQLKLNNNPRDRILKWIPYDEFIDIKEIGQSGLATTVWKEGPLFYNENEGWIRLSYQKVILKFLYDSENITDEFINKVESYLADEYDVCYGISQNSDTKDYILIFSNDYLVHRCKKCGYCYGISKIPGKIGLTTAIWKNGPLSYDAQHNKKWDSTYDKVSLRYLHNSQDSINEFINKV